MEHRAHGVSQQTARNYNGKYDDAKEQSVLNCVLSGLWQGNQVVYDRPASHRQLSQRENTLQIGRRGAAANLHSTTQSESIRNRLAASTVLMMKAARICVSGVAIVPMIKED